MLATTKTSGLTAGFSSVLGLSALDWDELAVVATLPEVAVVLVATGLSPLDGVALVAIVAVLLVAVTSTKPEVAIASVMPVLAIVTLLTTVSDWVATPAAASPDRVEAATTLFVLPTELVDSIFVAVLLGAVCVVSAADWVAVATTVETVVATAV